MKIKNKIEIALNIVIIILALLLTIGLLTKGIMIASVIAGGIALLNIITLILRFKGGK